MPSFLNTLAVIIASIGAIGAVAVWPQGQSLPPFAYAVPLAILLNAAILAGMLAGLATLINHVDAIRRHLRGQSSPQAGSVANNEPADGAKVDAGQVGQRGLSADGRVQVLSNYQVRQHADGEWRVEHLDGSPHEAVPGSFPNLGTAKRAAAKVL